MSLVWSQLQKANLLYGQAIDLDGFSKCLDLTEVNFQDLMLISQDNLDFCQKGLMNTKRHRRNSDISTIVDIKKNIKINSRKIRSISIGSYLLGEGSSILDLENSLHNTIDHFNKNFQSMVDFDDNLVASLSSLQDDIERIGNEDFNLHTSK